jgi:hypothetical protein
MKKTKVKVHFEFKHSGAAEVLPLGFETELVPIYSDKDKIVANEQRKNGAVISPAIIAPKGSYEGYTFIGANDETYDDHWIYLMVGYKTISDIFEKI